MAGLGEALISVGADTSQFENSLAEALENALGKNKFVQVLATSAGAAVTAIIAEFAPLERAILQIFQVQGVEASDALFNALSTQLLDVASRVGKPAQEVGAAIALGIGRGFEEQDAIDLAETASNLAVSLGEGLDPSMKGLTASLNGFNLGIEEADRVAGVLFQTVAKSGIPMSQLAQQLGNVAPSARNAGVSIEDAAAAIATMVQQGISAAESTTQIRTAITELSREGSDGGKVFKEIAGKTFPEFIKAGNTLGDALGIIQAASDKSGYSVAELTGNYNTQNATIAVAVNGLENYRKNLAANEKGQEAWSNAIDTANQGVIRQFQIALNDVRTGIQQIGLALRPLIQEIAGSLTGSLQGASEWLKNFALQISNTDFTPAIEGVRKFIQLLAPIGSLVGAVFALLAGLDWGNIFDTLQASLMPVIAMFGLISQAIGVLAKLVVAATPAIQGLVNAIVAVLAPIGVLAGVVAGFSVGAIAMVAGVAAIGAAVGGIITVVGKLISFLNLLRLAFMAVWASALGPVGAIVLAIAAVSAAIYVAYQRSETFRKGFVAAVNVAISAVNMLKDAIVTGVQWMLKAMLTLPQAWLEVADTILAGLEWLPDWMGGGVVDGARAGVQKLLGHIGSIKSGIDNLANAARNADIDMINLLSSTERAAEAAAHAGLWFGNEATDKALAEALRGKTTRRRAPGGLPTPNTSGLDELMNPSKMDNSKQKAADALKRVKDMLGDIFKAVQKLAEDAAEMSVDALENGFDSIIEKYNDAIAAAAAIGNATVVKQLRTSLADIKRFEKQLVKLATRRDLVSDRLKAASDTLKDLRAESNAFEASIKAAFVNIGSVAEASAGIGVTFRGIRNNLRDAIRTTQAFSTAMAQLQKLNLNPASLKQLADAGPAALDQARALARSGAAGVNEINKLQAELEKLAGKNATALEKEFFAAGIAAADGIVKGLQSQQAAIIKEMDKIADAMVNAVKKKLKIKSPSGVFDEEIGRQVPAGAAVGVRRGIPELVKAVDAMAAASVNAGANFGPGSVAVNGVSDPDAARRAGILAGEGIALVLERRRTAAKLAGV